MFNRTGPLAFSEPPRTPRFTEGKKRGTAKKTKVTTSVELSPYTLTNNPGQTVAYLPSIADAIRISLKDAPRSTRQRRLDEATILDYDADGNLIGIELLNVGAHVDNPDEITYLRYPHIQPTGD